MKWICLGDMGTITNPFLHLINNEKNRNNNLIVSLGDNFYPFGIDKNNRIDWNKIKYIYETLNLPLFSILGNHDYHKDPYEQLAFKLYNWKMPYFYYYAIHKFNNYKVGMWFLDTQILTMEGPDIDKYTILKKTKIRTIQENAINWLHQTLNTNVDCKIVYGHYPIFSNGNYSDNNTLINILLPIFKKYNVKFYFSGHDHTFQYINKEGIHQFICGSTSYMRPYFTNFNENTFAENALMRCEIKNNNLIVEGVNDKNIVFFKKYINL